jgi:hypothetical protein
MREMLSVILGSLLVLRVLQQIEEANQIKSELEQVTMQRFRLALRTPNATFTAADASALLSYWNVSSDDSRSLLERALRKNPVDLQIQELETVEIAFEEKEIEYSEAQRDYKLQERALQQARAEKVLALQAEKRAREALAFAQRRVAESKSRVNDTTKALTQAGSTVERVMFERERLLNGMTRQQEIVRNSMKRKEEDIGLKDSKSDVPDDADLRRLLKKEEALNTEYSRLEVMAAQLQSKANNLKERAESLKKNQ